MMESKVPYRNPCLRVVCVCFAVWANLFAADGTALDSTQFWAQILELDRGPTRPDPRADQARNIALEHLAKQEAALRGFLDRFPKDPHSFEAGLRLARLLQIRADIDGEKALLHESVVILDGLEKSAQGPQRAEIDFVRLSMKMRTLRNPSVQQRADLVGEMRKFQSAHPEDRRVAGLLAEVAGLFELEPKTMRSLLLEAEPLARDEELRAEIADDLKRLDLLGQPLLLEWNTYDGKPFRIEQMRGSVVVVVFFALWSQPALQALDTLKAESARWPKAGVQVVGFSLDPGAPTLSSALEARALTWPVGYDGKGWASPVVRALGINALPTVWLVDKKGRLRSLKGLEAMGSQIRQLLSER